jgi:hypothetical protein
MASRMLKLRRPGECVVCGCALPVGTEAWWNATARTVTCAACCGKTIAEATVPTQRELDRGQPAASVAREYQRRRHNREARTRATHPWIGGLLLTLRSPPNHETAFHRGELGEQAVATALERRTAQGPAILLHDRRMPGGRGNIDHLAVAATGIYVIDAKSHHGKVGVTRPIFGAPKLLIAGRNRTKLLDGLERQVAVVRDALAAAGQPEIPVQGVLCFTNADLPLLGTPKIRGHLMLGPRHLAKRLNAGGPLSPPAIEAIAHTLASTLPRA